VCYGREKLSRRRTMLIESMQYAKITIEKDQLLQVGWRQSGSLLVEYVGNPGIIYRDKSDAIAV
jgi:hypothetical protein